MMPLPSSGGGSSSRMKFIACLRCHGAGEDARTGRQCGRCLGAGRILCDPHWLERDDLGLELVDRLAIGEVEGLRHAKFYDFGDD